MMKKLLLLIFFFAFVSAFSQEDAWVYFGPKQNTEAYYSDPLSMLSQRSLDRRTTQGISLDDKDIPLSGAYIAQISAQPGITVKAKSKWLNAVHVRGSQEEITALADLPFVESIDFANASLNPDPNGRHANSNKFHSVKKQLDVQADFNYGGSDNQISMLNGDILHQMNYTGSGKIIAVLDAGFPGVDTAQPFQRLHDNNLILGGYDFVNKSQNFYTGNSHGAMVLSTMGGFSDGQLVGTAPDASYYLFITEDTNSENPVEESNWVEAAEKADSLGVDVINTSLGYFQYDNPDYSYTYQNMDGQTSFIARGADVAFSRGMVVVVAAGNSGGTANPHIGTPADAVNVLSVGAVDFNKNYAPFSSTGPSFDGRVKPDVMAKGAQATLSEPSGNITTANGTSFASPIMAGMVASLWQALPDKTNAEIVQLIKSSANYYETPNVQYGYGIPDFNIALANGLSVITPEKRQFLLYPNPVQNKLTFIFPDGFISGNITFYNTIGQQIKTLPMSRNATSLDVASLQSGFYLYKIDTNNFSQTGKLFKK